MAQCVEEGLLLLTAKDKLRVFAAAHHFVRRLATRGLAILESVLKPWEEFPMKHLLKLLDLSKEEILTILNLADQLKYEQKHNIEHHYLKGKTLGMIFEKSSTRTRVSFETGMYQLGGMPIFLSANDLQIGRGEPVQDTARVLSRYLDGIMIRTYEQEEVESLARYGTIPVINGLTDFCHPCQGFGGPDDGPGVQGEP